MAERKLLVGPQDAEGTFAKAFGKAARLPTQEDKDAALEQSIAEMRKELHRPEYQPATVDTRRAAGNGTGWQNEIPISTPEGIGLIDRIVNAHSPQPSPRVEIKDLRKIDAKEIRDKLDWAVSCGKLSRAQADAALRDLGIGPDEPEPELVDA
jgi:hypothetical protein